MKKLTLLVLAALIIISFAIPSLAQEPMPPDGQEQAAAMPDDDDGSPADEAGSPGCMCQNCMMGGKMGGMMGGMCGNMKGMPAMGGMMSMRGKMGGMAGMRGGIDMMTWPPMHKSCRTPEFYLHRSEGLGLSDEQVAALRKLQAALRKEQILKGAAVKALELDLSEIVTMTDFKLPDAVAKLKEIEKARLELRSTVLKYSSDARDQLSPEQLEKVKELGTRRCYNCGMAMPGMGEKNPEGMKRQMMEKMRNQMMNQ